MPVRAPVLGFPVQVDCRWERAADSGADEVIIKRKRELTRRGCAVFEASSHAGGAE